MSKSGDEPTLTRLKNESLDKVKELMKEKERFHLQFNLNPPPPRISSLAHLKPHYIVTAVFGLVHAHADSDHTDVLILC